MANVVGTDNLFLARAGMVYFFSVIPMTDYYFFRRQIFTNQCLF